MKSTWGILRASDFQFQPLPPETNSFQLLNDATAAIADNRRGRILTQYFHDFYAHAWLYDAWMKHATTLQVALPQTAAVMIYVLKGEASLHTTPFHDAHFPENSYSLLALEPAQHTIALAPGHCRILFLQLTAPLYSLLDESQINLPRHGHKPGFISNDCRQLLRGLHQTTYSGEVWQLKRQVIILDLLFKTFDQTGVGYKSGHAQTTHRDYDTLKQVKEYVCDNIHKKLSLQILAARFAIAPSLLRRAYKKVFNHHLTDFIREMRLARARLLLQSTSLTVHEIAWEVGYESSTSFTRVFTTYFQQSPTDFRRHSIRAG